MENKYGCIKEKEIAVLQSEVKTLFKENKILRDEIDDLSKLYELIYGLTTNVSLLTEQMSRTREDLSEFKKDTSKDLDSIKKDIKQITMQPADDFKYYKKIIIGQIITAIIMFLLGKFL